MAVEIKPSLPIAHENLAKLALRSDKLHQNFWEFWNASRRKKLVAVILGVYALCIIIFYPLLFGLVGNEVVETKKVGHNGTTNYSSYTTVTSKPSKMPEIYLVIVGLVIVILLSPEITRAKVGPVELDLSEEPKRPSIIEPIHVTNYKRIYI